MKVVVFDAFAFGSGNSSLLFDSNTDIFVFWSKVSRSNVAVIVMFVPFNVYVSFAHKRFSIGDAVSAAGLAICTCIWELMFSAGPPSLL